MTEHSQVYLKQKGGKYTTFTCPSCGKPKQDFKMSANHGGCSSCGTMYQALELEPVEKGEATEVDYYATLEELH